MADQAGPGTVTGLTGGGPVPSPATPASSAHPAHHHGRPVSWVAVSLIMIGFVVGGLGLIAGPAWWAFWTGAGITVVGALIATATNIFDDWY